MEWKFLEQFVKTCLDFVSEIFALEDATPRKSRIEFHQFGHQSKFALFSISVTLIRFAWSQLLIPTGTYIHAGFLIYLFVKRRKI